MYGLKPARWGTGWVTPTPPRPTPAGLPVGWFAGVSIAAALQTGQATASEPTCVAVWDLEAAMVTGSLLDDTDLPALAEQISESEPFAVLHVFTAAELESGSLLDTLGHEFEGSGSFSASEATAALEALAELDGNIDSEATAAAAPSTAADAEWFSEPTAATAPPQDTDLAAPAMGESIPDAGVQVLSDAAGGLDSEALAGIGLSTEALLESGSLLDGAFDLLEWETDSFSEGGALAEVLVDAQADSDGFAAAGELIADLEVGGWLDSEGGAVLGEVLAGAAAEWFSEVTVEVEVDQPVEVTVVGADAVSVSEPVAAAEPDVDAAIESGSLLDTGLETELVADSFSEAGGGIDEVLAGLDDNLDSQPVFGIDEVFAGMENNLDSQPTAALAVQFVLDNNLDSEPVFAITSVASVGAATSGSALTTSGLDLTGGATSASTVTGAINEITDVLAEAVSDDLLDVENEFTQLLPIMTTDPQVIIPPWVKKIDAIALGGGAGSSGSTALGKGLGGDGGVWAAPTTVTVEKLLLDADVEASRVYVEATVGKGGTGGPGASLFGGFQPGQPGGATTISFYADPIGGGTRKLLYTMRASGGNPNMSSVALNQSNDGGAVTGGNANAGKDLVFEGVTYMGGAEAPGGTTTARARPPGGGGPGNAAGSSNNGWPGADGRIWLNFYSGSKVQQQAWTAAGTYTSTLPLTTDRIWGAALGGGGGGDGGQNAAWGSGGTGGKWDWHKGIADGTTTTIPGTSITIPGTTNWRSIDTLLAAKGLTRDAINRLWVDVTVGGGGKGGNAAPLIGTGSFTNDSGGDGVQSTLALMCRVTASGASVELFRLTGAAGSGGGNKPNRGGAEVTGGNANMSGLSSEPGRDVRVTLDGKTYAFKGGAAAGNNPGNPPGGGGGGGGIGVGVTLTPGGAGTAGAAGAAHLIFTT